MAARNSERLLNLVFALLATPRYISREQIRTLVEGYSLTKTDVAFQRMFERDKEELRVMGIEILVGPTDPFTDEMDGYRIDPDDFYLREVHLTPAESRVVALATALWSDPTIESGVERALAKLRAGGVEIDHERVSFLSPRITSREQGFPILWEAMSSRTPVAFTYAGKPRKVEVWKLTQRRGSWYLFGEESGKGPRTYKVSRMEDTPRMEGSPGSYTIPPASVIEELTASIEPPQPTQSVRVALRESAAYDLRRRGRPCETSAPEGFEAMEIAYARDDEIIASICAAGPDALVLDEGEIRDGVIAHLRAVGGTR